MKGQLESEDFDLTILPSLWGGSGFTCKILLLLQDPTPAPVSYSCSRNLLLLQDFTPAPGSFSCSRILLLLQEPTPAPGSFSCSRNLLLLQEPTPASVSFSCSKILLLLQDHTPAPHRGGTPFIPKVKNDFSGKTIVIYRV